MRPAGAGDLGKISQENVNLYIEREGLNVEQRLTAAAEADLEAIGDYIARDNLKRAASFVRELYQLCLECLEIGEMPEA